VRIPVTKVYRAFPQLDEFSDEECQRFVLRAEQDYPGSKTTAMFTGVVALLIGLIVLGVLESYLWTAISANMSALGRANARETLVLLSAGFMVLCFGVGMFCVRDRWLIRTITLRVRQTSCPGCGYSLLGLAVDKGVVKCPECAAPYFLADHGLTAEDLLAPRSGA
jgi:hypothetical protein